MYVCSEYGKRGLGSMSGGSYSYIYHTLSNECEGRMHDAEMDDLVKDLCKVLHDLEWWQSGDSSKSCYRNTLTKFKAKWFKGDRQERLKGYIDEQIDIVRSQLYSLVGESQESEEDDKQKTTGYCKDCKWWKDSDGVYRRGVGAESQCPINHKEVYDGKGYCFLFKSQESEDGEQNE